MTLWLKSTESRKAEDNRLHQDHHHQRYMTFLNRVRDRKDSASGRRAYEVQHEHSMTGSGQKRLASVDCYCCSVGMSMMIQNKPRENH
ncbi:hypothetical protein DPMN_161557 [Dreissena polymorpha]|uniref:Uncharacterized protein n=1 Tax=Dreissena polymorpha TaxID=45954 RepID=A0A9D4ET92_DREPO|nr:hypothetical protein DPMN_161557 [Dreissena polymorpha]